MRTWYPENGRSDAPRIALAVFDETNRQFAQLGGPQPKILSIRLDETDVRRICEIEVELANDVVTLVRYGATDDEDELDWDDDPEMLDVDKIVYLILYWTVGIKHGELTDFSNSLQAAQRRLEQAFLDWSTRGCPLELIDLRLVRTRIHHLNGKIGIIARFWNLNNELRRAVDELEADDIAALTSGQFRRSAAKAGERQRIKTFLKSLGAHGTIDQIAVNTIALHHNVAEVLRSRDFNVYPALENPIYLCEDGHVSCIAASPSRPSISWYDNVVHVNGVTLPEAVLFSLPGRPITSVIDHRVLSSNMIVTRAHVDTDSPEPVLVIEFEQPRLLFCRYTGRVWEEPT